MKRRNLLKGIGTGSLLALGAPTAAAESDCFFECCNECAERDWVCDNNQVCDCIEFCPRST